MASDSTFEIKNLASSDGTVLTERVDHWQIGSKAVAMEVVGVFEVDSEERITRWRDYYDLPTLAASITAASVPWS